MKKDTEAMVQSYLSENYWLRRLENVAYNAVYGGKTDLDDSSVKTFDQSRFSLPGPLAETMKKITGGSQAKTFLMFITALNILAYKYTGINDILIATPGFQDDNPGEYKDVLLFLRTEVNEDSILRDLLNTAFNDLNEAYEHRHFDYQFFFDRFCQQHPENRKSLTALGLVYDGFNRESGLADGLDLVFSIRQHSEKFVLIIKYDTQEYQQHQVDQLARHFITILTSMLADLDKTPRQIDILSGEDRRKLLVDFSGKTVAYKLEEKNFISSFEAQVKRSPLAPAVKCEDKTLTYRQLNEISNRLARFMQKEGAVLREDLVAILMERSEKMPISIIAAWKCGAAYVPIDPDYPGHRVKTIIEDSGSKLVVTEKGILHPQLKSDLKSMAKIVYLDEMEKILENQSSKNLNIDVQPGDLAYIIYTSGSTGQPKGVMVEHRGMMNHLYAKIADIKIDSESVVVQNASQCFDISIWQFFVALLVGGRTVIYPQWLVLSPETLIRHAGTDGVTILEVVPSYLSMMLDTIDERKLQHVFPVLRYLLVTGETVRPGLVKRWFEKFPGIKMTNAYGPTEASDDITHFIMDRFPGGDSIPIGKTLRNFRIYILDSRMKLCPPGIKGEICVSGIGIGRGYLNNPELTAQKFDHDFRDYQDYHDGYYRSYKSYILYKTGDIGRYLPDGNIEFFGRKDYQVKIRGFRIEMEEIENKLSTMEDICSAVVMDKEDKSGNKHLYAYVTLTGDTGKKQEEIKRQLRDVLPEYMIPSKIVIMETLPLTPNGKVDRKALPEPGEADIRGMEYVAPRNAVEKKLAEIWQEVLGIEKIAVHDNFFNLGGDSFKGIHIVNKVQEWLQEVVHVTVLFLAPTIEELAIKLESYKKVDFETRVGAVEIAEIRSLIQPLSPLPHHLAPRAKLPPVLFILCPSRSGSTLLRVILAGHPKLFAPQEFELLSFNTLAERKEALSGKFSLYLEGVIRAIMEIKQIDADKAKAIMEGFEAQGMTVPEFYGVLQSWLDGRILVEKTPQYTYDIKVLKRAETYFDSPLYIHLVRHPYAVIHSYENARLDQLFKYEHRFSSRQLGELLWLTCHQNILEFLGNIPASRKYQMKYEDLVDHPEAIVSQMCHHFGLEFYPPMLDIYGDAEKRMTDGIYAESKMLGDVKFFTHKSIDTQSVEKWKEKYKKHFLGDETVKIAKSFGYLEEIIEYSKIGIAPQKEYYMLSPAQKRLWILNCFQENSTAYNIPKAYLVTGNLEIAALEKAYETVLRRHQSLRTTFITLEGEPRQKINDFQSMGFKLEYVDLRNQKDREEQSKNLTLREAGAAFDLEKGPLLRIKLIHLEDKKYVFLLSMHHIISDGWSMRLLTNEILMLYEVYKNGGDARLPGLRFQYKDYSEWLNRESMKKALKRQEEYWLKEYEGEVPVLNLPIDYSRPSVWSFEGNATGFELGEEETEALNKLARSEGVSLFIVLLAIYNIFLAKISGQEDIVVGIATAGRNHPDMERIIGLFVNTLALRNYPVGEMGFKAFLHQVKQRTLRSFENQDYPFEELVEKVVLNRDMSHNPLIDAMFVLQNISEPAGEVHQAGLNDVTLESYPYEQTISKFDLSLAAVEMGKKVKMSFEYGTKLFKEETIHRFIQHFKKVISSVTGEPVKSLGEIKIISGEEKKRLLYDFNETETDYPADKTIHELFEQQVQRTPDHLAVIYAPMQLTYRESDEKSNRLAHVLIKKGVEPDTVVGIKVERSIAMIIGILSILKAGGAYLPLDPDYPQERIDFLLKDSGAEMMLTTTEIGEVVDGANNMFQTPVTAVAQKNNLANVIYTSGSTGRPKGVMVKHQNVVRLVKNTNYISFEENKRLLPTGSLGFDASTFEIWGSLLNGLILCLVDTGVILSPHRLKEAVQKYDIAIMWMTSSLFNQLFQVDTGIFANLEHLIVGGDVLSVAHINRLKKQFPGINVSNGYGPTENTTFSTTYLIESGHTWNIPIGRPIANSTAYIMGTDNHLQPVGVPGELVLGGDGVARGYLNDPELTAEKFVHDLPMQPCSHAAIQLSPLSPLPPFPHSPIYHTGDLARWLPDGNIQFLGRIDRQVKISGYRVEVGEIESQLKNHKEVKDAVVITREDKNGDKYLCAYIIASSSREGVDELREYLSSKLPGYMIPSYFVQLAEMPLTPNGKIDRKALPAPGIKPGEEYAAPGNVMEKKLVAIWQEILGIENIGIKSSFFQLGGNSLKVITLISFIHRDFGIRLPVVEIFRHDTIEEQAELLRGSPGDPFASIEPAPAADYYAVSSVQRRLLFLQLFNPRNMSYNMHLVLLLEGDHKREKIETVFRQLIHRHESLRTSFHMIDDEAKQRVHQPGTVNFNVEYYQAKGDKSSDQSPVIDAFVRPFDLSLPPLFRVGIIRLDHPRWIFVIDIHHIISDGISQSIFFRELMALYKGEALPPLRIQYKDFAQWLNKKEQVMRMQQQEAYWLKQFEGELPLLLLPTDYDRPAAQTFEGGKILFQMGETLTAALKAYAAQEASTLFMLTQALFNLILSRLSGQEDIIIGTSVAGRRHADLENIIGMFVNALALRNYPARDKSFREFLREVKQNTLEAFENQDYQLEDLLDKVSVERIPGRNPLFDVMLVLNNEEYPGVEIPGLKLDWYPYKKKSAQMDLKLRMMEIAGNLRCSIEYSSKLFREETVKRLADYFITAAGAALADPLKKLAEIDILPEQERQQLLVEFNNTRKNYPLEIPIHRLFQQQVQRTPGNIAIFDPSAAVIQYRQLNRNANQLARLLRKHGVRTGAVVGLMMERSIDMVTGLLAILKTGGAYLPIDTGLPRERVRYMLEDSDARILLSNSRAVDEITFTALRDFESKSDVKVVMTPKRNHIREFDRLPMPDRSAIDMRNYKNKIGMASVTNGISLQATRGCPYECLFCHKVWSKLHVYRSAENIYNEVEYYYKKGVVNFSFIDDCFNLNKENSKRFFQLLIKNKLNLQLFFPNGLRGDRLSPQDIDLMVEAGTRGINLSLETASPRLQKLIKKNLDIDKFKQVMDYIAAKHPEVILEIATMHGFPGETQEEALMTLDFIKSIRWIHFPYIHILKIYPNTEMEALALQHGISREDIMASKDLAYHELPETLPFPKSFTRKYQTDFMNDYFLRKDRLKHVLPVQLNILSQDAMLQKYNAYLPTKIDTPEDILKLVDMEMTEMNGPGITLQEREAGGIIPEIFENPPGIKDDSAGKKKILLLDLSQHFSSSDENMLYNVVEQPLGLIYLLTYIRQQLGDKITGKIYKAGNDFDSFPDLKALVEAYQPDLVGIRTLTYYKEFFHETAALLRQWGVTAPIIAGGPYATSDYHTILKDRNIDLAVYGEGEYTMVELLAKMLETDFKIPGEPILRKIPGLVFAKDISHQDKALEVILADVSQESILKEETADLEPFSAGENLAYVMYTSGSTGKPKGVMVEHRQVNNCLCWMQDMFALTETDVVVQRTNLTFDPSVWEIFWPLHKGAAVKIIDDARRKDAAYLIEMLSKNHDLTVMYCPSTLLSAMAHYLDMKEVKPRMKLPRLIIGAEPVTMEVIKVVYSCFEGRIVNTYGPTEGTINNTYYELDPGDSRSIVPIGKPVANNRLYILSTDLKLLPIGAAGEICIAGSSVSRGYINNREKTSAHFIPNPFGPGKLYKTGDIGRWLADGNIEIMGRSDDQVKIRGHRIELGEIEAALCHHPSILDTVVVAKTAKELKEDIRECKTCGIWSNYPGIRINDESVCNICENLTLYKQLINRYFKTAEDFELKIREGNRNRKGKYDCLLVYACERVATYALYKLLDMGFKVLTITYDSGHYEKASMDRIKRITSQIGVDHILLTHPNSDKILKESLRTAKTMCKGCIHTSTSLAGQYAYQNDIKFVIGETLSRGQIVENKLFKFLEMGIHEVREIEREVDRLMRSVASLDKNIFDQINIDIVNDGTMYDKVEFIDFYRYFDITNEEMAAYLDEKDSYWKNLENRAAYSTDCKICEVGDFNHFKELGYHYTGSAKSWEKRLGLVTMKEVKEDLKLAISAEEHAEFLNKLGYKRELPVAEDQKYICAYYVPTVELDKAELRTYLAAKLPDYMVPTYFVRLEKVPLNSNGKIDRKKLPGLEILIGGDSIAPRDELEEKLVKIWENVLGNEILRGSIGIDDNFFELGGHSLKATVMASKIHKELNVQVPLAEVFKRSTIRGLAQYINGTAKRGYEEISSVEAKEYYELSSAQKRMFIMQHMQKDNLNYNMPVVFVVEGNLEKEKLEQVLKKLIKRHENLRTSFEMTEQQPIQRIHQNYDFAVDYYERNEEAAAELVKTFVRPFDLGKIPLLRVRMVKVEDTKYLLMYDMHHIISDGTSMGIFANEFMALYERKELPPLRIQYKDFSGWQNRKEGIESLKNQEKYWLKEFAGDVPLLNLPTDYERPAIVTGEGNSVSFEIDIEETKLLKKMALETGATLYMVLLALFNVLLSRICDQEDITIGAPIAGRRHTDLEPLIGFFVNTLALRNFPTREKTFREFLLEIKQKTLIAFENQDYQFEDLVDNVLEDRESNRNSLVDVLFVFQNVVVTASEIPEVSIPGLTLKPYMESINASPFDLLLIGVESGEKLAFSFHYRTKLFKEETVQMLIRNFKEVAAFVLDNQNIHLKNIEISHDLLALEPISLQEDEGDFKF